MKRIIYKLKRQHPGQDQITINRKDLQNVPQDVDVKPLTI